MTPSDETKTFSFLWSDELKLVLRETKLTRSRTSGIKSEKTERKIWSHADDKGNCLLLWWTKSGVWDSGEKLSDAGEHFLIVPSYVIPAYAKSHFHEVIL